MIHGMPLLPLSCLPPPHLPRVPPLLLPSFSSPPPLPLLLPSAPPSLPSHDSCTHYHEWALTLLQHATSMAIACVLLKDTTDPLLKFLVDPTSRLNRCLRYVILISFLQWGAQYIYLFPNLLVALLEVKGSAVIIFGFLVLVMVGVGRGVFWLFFPSSNWNMRYAQTGPGRAITSTQPWMGAEAERYLATMGAATVEQAERYLAPHILDIVLVSLWMFWMGLSVAVLFWAAQQKLPDGRSNRGILKRAGLHLERFSDDGIWITHIALFK